MSNFKTWEDYFFDKHPNCLRNKLNITDPEKLSVAESKISFLRLSELEQKPIPKNLDLTHLQAIHKHLFQDVYAWAGENRTVDIVKSYPFAPHTIINQGSHFLFTKLSREQNLKGLDAKHFSDRAGYYLGEINHLHPFREGNGRTQRAFMNHLAAKNNYFISWEHVSQKEMIDASIEGHKGNHQHLSDIIHKNLVDREYALLLKQQRQGNAAEMHRAAEGQTYHGRIIGVTERYVVQELQDQPQSLVVHARQRLAQEVRISHQSVEISYPYGDIGLVSEHEQELGQDREISEYER